MNRRFLVLTVAIVAIAVLAANPASAQTKLLRFPDISGHRGCQENREGGRQPGRRTLAV